VIDLKTLSRVRLRRNSTVVHSVTASTMRTGCGYWALLYDTWGRRSAVEPLPPRTAVTCRRCVAADRTAPRSRPGVA